MTTLVDFNNRYPFHPAYAWVLVTVLSAAFVAAFLSLQAGFFLLLFAATAWFAWKHPEEGFLLLLVLIPILPMLKITQTIGTFSLIKDVLIISLCIRQFVVPLLRKHLPYRRNVLFAPILALVLWSLLATLQADSLILGILRLRDIGLYVLAYFAVLYLPKHDIATMRRRLMWFGVTVGITLLLAIWQWFFAVDSAVLRFDPVRSVWIPRLSSVLAHPSIYGEYLITALALALGIASVVTKKYRVWAGASAIVLLPFIFLTYSRAVWLGAAAAIAIISFTYGWRLLKEKTSLLQLGRWGGAALVVVVVVAVTVLRFTPAGGLLRSIVDPTYSSNEERVTFFVRLVAPLTTKQVIIGNGLGDVLAQNFRDVDLETYDIAAGDTRAVQLTKNRTLVDNQHLKTVIEMGVVGFGIYTWLYGRLLLAAIRAALSRNNIAIILGFWGIGFLTAFILQGFFIDIWDIFPTNLLFWIIAALLSANMVHSHRATDGIRRSAR